MNNLYINYNFKDEDFDKFFKNRDTFKAWIGKAGLPNFGWEQFDKQVMDGSQPVGEREISVIVDKDDEYLFEQIYCNGVMPDTLHEDREMGL